MRNPCFRKFLFLVFIAGLMAAVSGCETVGAMKAGEIKMQDFVQMAKATLPGTVTRPRSGNSGDFLGMDLAEMDAWFKNNLW